MNRYIQALVELYVIGVLIVFGMMANVVSIIVLKRYRERRDSLFLLQALAVVDCLYLAAAALRYPLKYLLTPGADADPYVDMQPTVFPLLKTFQVEIVHLRSDNPFKLCSLAYLYTISYFNMEAGEEKIVDVIHVYTSFLRAL